MTEQSANKTFDYELFRSTYKPHIRPDDMARQMQTVFRMDPQFVAQHRYLRKFLLADRINWSEDIITHLTHIDALGDKLNLASLNTLRGLYKTHADLFRIGKYGEEYLDSVEDLALFFIHIDVKSLWLTGAYRELSLRLIDLIVERSANNRTLPLGGTMQALTTALLIEINQIQRTYTMYERYVSKSLVSDLTKSSFMKDVRSGQEPPSPQQTRKDPARAE